MSKNDLTFDICVLELVTFTTSALSGDANTTQSFLDSAIDIKLSMCVAVHLPAINSEKSTVSESTNLSYAIFNSATLLVEPSAPADKLSKVGVFTAVNVVPAALLPQFEPDVLWSIQ